MVEGKAKIKSWIKLRRELKREFLKTYNYYSLVQDVGNELDDDKDLVVHVEADIGEPLEEEVPNSIPKPEITHDIEEAEKEEVVENVIEGEGDKEEITHANVEVGKSLLTPRPIRTQEAPSHSSLVADLGTNHNMFPTSVFFYVSGDSKMNLKALERPKEKRGPIDPTEKFHDHPKAKGHEADLIERHHPSTYVFEPWKHGVTLDRKEVMPYISELDDDPDLRANPLQEGGFDAGAC